MKRLIKYYSSIGKGEDGLFSDCSTKYEILELFPDSADGHSILTYAATHGIAECDENGKAVTGLFKS